MNDDYRAKARKSLPGITARVAANEVVFVTVLFVVTAVVGAVAGHILWLGVVAVVLSAGLVGHVVLRLRGE